MKCNECGASVGILSHINGCCAECHLKSMRAFDPDAEAQIVERRAENNALLELQAKADKVILTTDPAHKLEVIDHLEIVSAEVVVGMNIFKDLFTEVRDLVGGRTRNVQNALRDIRKEAMDELRMEAAKVSANAVVGVNLSYAEIGGKTMLMLVASGTAVRVAT